MMATLVHRGIASLHAPFILGTIIVSAAYFMAFNYQQGVPACREQGSLRFHLWRHSHSVPVRWRRGAAQAAQAAEQVERAAHPEPQATQAAGAAVRVATALLNPPAAKAVRLAMALLNPPAARARIALTPQGRELGRGAPVRTAKELQPPPNSVVWNVLSGRQRYLSILDRSHSLLCLRVQAWHEPRPWLRHGRGFEYTREGHTKDRVCAANLLMIILASTFTWAPTLRHEPSALLAAR